MKSLKIFLLLALVMATAAMAVSTDFQSGGDESSLDNITGENSEPAWHDEEQEESQEATSSVSLRGSSRFLAQEAAPPRAAILTCNKHPRICRAKGSPGPDCCKKKCVNVLTDRLNCGTCGKKCKYSQICCKGECVNPMTNKKHCGGCNSRCKKGSACVYGMCNYA